MLEGLRGTLQEPEGEGRQHGLTEELHLSGMVEAHLADKDTSVEDKEIATRLVKSRVVHSNGEVKLTIVKEIHNVASVCQVVQTPKKGFINIAVYPCQDNDLLIHEVD